MNTMVETYLLQENVELVTDAGELADWKKLVGDLGLEGQKALSSFNPEASPIPFLWINRGMKNMFEALCPTAEAVEKFGKTPIPKEVLDLVALSRKEQYFTDIQVWYDDGKPDPICVGRKKVNSYTHDHWLIARWGAERKTLPALREEARTRLLARFKSDLTTTITEAKSKLENLERLVEAHLQGTTLWV